MRDGVAVLPIKASDLSVVRQGRRVLAVDSVRIGDSACTAIIGPNGAGKSLMLRALGGLMKLDAGSVTWAGVAAPEPGRAVNAEDRRRRLAVGFVSHRPSLLARSARHNLEFALRAGGFTAQAAKQRASRVLEEAGLAAIVNTPAQRLSAGEQQRLALARALALEPAILLLDEPTASVDPVSTAPIEAMLKHAAQHGCKIVIVSHDLNQVKRLADVVLLMNRGSVVEQEAVGPFFEQPKSTTARKWLAGELLV